METSEEWENDEFVQEHYSDPGSHFYEFEENAEYDPATNTVTITASNIDDIWQATECSEEEELKKAIDELNEYYAEKNGIKFIWR
jgi:hypothetical protein